MPDTTLRRHDLVWLDPAGSMSSLAVAAADRTELRSWIDRRLPLVVGRQDAQQPGVRLGFTLPGTGARRRVEVRAPRSAILTHRAPPRLADMIGHAPGAWQARLEVVAAAFAQVELSPRVYGSLVTEAFSGEACVRLGSDVDVLIECATRDECLAALAVLEAYGDGLPRLDGELRLPHGWAAAWRELARTRAAGGELLAKSDDGLQLMSAEEFLRIPFPDGAVHGNPDSAAAVRRPA
jgi:phosphoribosyl-dephospho-CoA transferase